jgi:hypothetical protein
LLGVAVLIVAASGWLLFHADFGPLVIFCLMFVASGLRSIGSLVGSQNLSRAAFATVRADPAPR